MDVHGAAPAVGIRCSGTCGMNASRSIHTVIGGRRFATHPHRLTGGASRTHRCPGAHSNNWLGVYVTFKMLFATFVLALGLVVVPSTSAIPEQHRATADAWSSGINSNFCGAGYWKWDGSSIRATGRTRLHGKFTFREYRRSMPGGFGYGNGWTTQWNPCYGILGRGPNYPTSVNFKGDHFSPR